MHAARYGDAIRCSTRRRNENKLLPRKFSLFLTVYKFHFFSSFTYFVVNVVVVVVVAVFLSRISRYFSVQDAMLKVFAVTFFVFFYFKLVKLLLFSICASRIVFQLAGSLLFCLYCCSNIFLFSSISSFESRRQTQIERRRKKLPETLKSFFAQQANK